MKYILITFYSLLVFSLYGQEIELFGGTSLIDYYDSEGRELTNFNNYSSDPGFQFGVTFDHIKIDSHHYSFFIQFEKYNGQISARSGGLGGGVRTTAEIEKSLISFGVHLLNRKIYKELKLGFAIVASGLVNESFSGTMKGYGGVDPATVPDIDLTEKYDQFNNSLYLGFMASLAYDIRLNDKFSLSPRYSFYLGATQEVRDFPTALRSMRHQFNLGIKRSI